MTLAGERLRASRVLTAPGLGAFAMMTRTRSLTEEPGVAVGDFIDLRRCNPVCFLLVGNNRNNDIAGHGQPLDFQGLEPSLGRRVISVNDKRRGSK